MRASQHSERARPSIVPFAAAAKTGTSKGFRDNLTVGFTPRVTVAVWVGNFDGSPMKGVSGVTGAGPLFNRVMRTVHQHFAGELGIFPEPDDRFVRVEVCALSGELPTDHCPHRHTEIFVRGTAPQRPCTMHEKVLVDVRNGLLAGPGCPDDQTREQVFETYGSRFHAWAKSAERALAPKQWSPECPGEGVPGGGAQDTLAIRYPYPGAVFLDDPSMPDGMQGVVVRADAPASVRQVTLVVDGRPVGRGGPPFERVIRLSPGAHEVWVEAGSRRSLVVSFQVR